MPDVKISVVTAVFNNRGTIGEALNSVLSQSHPHVELIVIDGMSTDGTRDVLDGFAKRLDVYVSEPDNGIYHALNKGIELATGDVIGFLHSDDVLADSRALERIAHAFRDAAVGAVYGDLVYVRQDDTARVVRTWHAGIINGTSLARGWMPPHPTFYARREIYERLGSFDTTFRIAADYDCMLRFLKAGIRVAYIPHLQVRMRVGGISNRSFASIVAKSIEDLRALRKNDIGAAVALICKNARKVPQFFLRSAT
jgi:glycosyltransferase involved in cell wall biosynthesis